MGLLPMLLEGKRYTIRSNLSLLHKIRILNRLLQCSEAGSVVCQGLGVFPGLGGGPGVSFAITLMAGSRPEEMNRALGDPFASLQGHLGPFLKASNVTSLLCILSELFYADK